MKLAYLVNQYPKTSHSFIRREIEALVARGHQVTRLTLRRPGEPLVDARDRAERARTRALLEAGPSALLGALAASGVREPRAAWRAARLALALGARSEAGLLRHAAYLAEAALLRRWLAAAGVEHLHAHFGTNAATVAALCRALGGPPFSFTVHGQEEVEREFRTLGERAAGAAFVAGVSRFGRSQLLRCVDPAHWARLAVLRCGVDPALLEVEPVPAPRAPRLVCVGRLSPAKGHLVLLEAAARLAEEGRDFELVLVGDGELRGAVEARARALRLGARVRITGWASGARVREEVLAARALVLASLSEGLPVALLEALALGRPVVATRVAGVPELVVPGENGWLVSPGCARELATALGEVLGAEPATLDRLGTAGRERVRALHDPRALARELEGLLRAS
ncbi:MAG: glycosyltransferase family 4 protein [Planctomycetota bacterium]